MARPSCPACVFYPPFPPPLSLLLSHLRAVSRVPLYLALCNCARGHLSVWTRVAPERDCTRLKKKFARTSRSEIEERFVRFDLLQFSWFFFSSSCKLSEIWIRLSHFVDAASGTKRRDRLCHLEDATRENGRGS